MSLNSELYYYEPFIMENTLPHFDRWFRTARATNKSVARRTGLSEGTVSAIRNGSRQYSFINFLAVVTALRVEPKDLLSLLIEAQAKAKKRLFIEPEDPRQLRLL